MTSALPEKHRIIAFASACIHTEIEPISTTEIILHLMNHWKTQTFSIVLILTTALAPSVSLFSQNSSDQAVLTVGEEAVPLTDFQHIFLKNNRDSVITQSALDEYVELFVNFKLKVQAAEALGMDTSETFLRELAGYRTQLARPYMTNNELLQDLVRQAWERKQEEVRARHILINCSADASPADTLRAWKRADALRQRVVNGEDFESVARSKAGSEDPSVKDNGGDLGWFTAFQMVYPFEEAAYTTPVGAVSPIVRTRYGYHFLEVTGRRDARGEIRTAHIMVRTREGASADELAQAESRIGQIHDLLGKGLAWEELAMKMSEDASTSAKAGELPWFGTGKMVEEFENAAFSLNEDGEISAPFQTSYGWHIVKRLEYKAPPSFEASKRELEKKVSRDSRSELTRASFIENLKTEYAFTVNAAVLKALKRYASKQDSVFYPGHPWTNVPEKEASKTLLTLAGQSAKASDFINHLNESKVRNLNRSMESIIDEELRQWSEGVLLDYEDGQLESKHDDFRLLMEEYHDGILLFELTDEKVWTRAVKDTSGLEAFHEANKANFMWDTRVSAQIFTCADAKVVKAVQKGIKKSADLSALQREINQDNTTALRWEEGMYSAGNNNWADQVLATSQSGALSLNSKGPTFVQYTGGGDELILVHVREIRQPEPKTLAEARGQVIAAYQDFLEAEWIRDMRSSTPVEINRSLLHSLAN